MSPFLAPPRSAHLLHAAFPLDFVSYMLPKHLPNEDVSELKRAHCPCQQASAVVQDHDFFAWQSQDQQFALLAFASLSLSSSPAPCSFSPPPLYFSIHFPFTLPWFLLLSMRRSILFEQVVWICIAVLATSTAHPCVVKNLPAVWPSVRVEAYLIPTWLMQEQRLAQVQTYQSIKWSGGDVFGVCRLASLASRVWQHIVSCIVLFEGCGGVQVSLLAAKLQQNAQEDYRVYHRIAAAGRRGVRPPMPHQMSDCWPSIISVQLSVHIRLSISTCSVRLGSPLIGGNDKDHGLSLRSSVADACVNHISSNDSTLYWIVTNCGCRCIVQCC